MLITLDAHCRGNEHIKNNKPLQDYSKSLTTDRWKSCAFALVADGHGGDKYFRSEIGSRLAVLYAEGTIEKVLNELTVSIKKKELSVINKTLNNLCSRIIFCWREKVKAHFHENPLTEKEIKLCEELGIKLPIDDEDIHTLYGSTLLASVYFSTLDFWFSLQIGDGKTVAIKRDNSVFYPIPEDDDMGFGVTASLCGTNAMERFHYNFGFDKLNSLIVMSDGLADSFDTEKLPNFLLIIQTNVIKDTENAKKELEEFLPKLSEQGSGDDISIAGIFYKEQESSITNILKTKK
ncbi:MAG: protein phosphatase 2C domain-containing protein [Treponema sp.]|nr:protein phosphatase 2C domain-containing protein [Treponema sp.]